MEDDATVLVSPIPSMFEELVAREVGFLNALSSEAVDHLSFGSDRGVVGARHPTSIEAHHTSAAHEDVLDSVVEHVAHVEHTCYVWWWDNYSIRLATVRFARKESVVEPILIPFLFYVLWIVFTC